jgi:regulator of protease activity HflC (stomatin/prohibitin superfamily)
MYKLYGGIAAGVVALLFIFNTFIIIGPGQRGILMTFGKVGAVWSEGIHFKIPVMQSVVKMSVQILKTEADAAAASKDLQQTDSKIVLNYHIIPDKVNIVYQSIGISYEDVVIHPAIQEAVKEVTSKYNAVELITMREKVKGEIQESLRNKLLSYNLVVDNFNIVNFSFSQQFEQAIEAKQTAEQNALKAQRDLERIKIEATQKVATAQAEAQALGMQRQQVTPEVLQLRWIEKWDGHLPEVQAGNGMIPMINLNTK